MAAAKKEEIVTIRVPVMGNPLNRDGVTSKDQRFINGYFDVLDSVEGKKYYYFCKRPGLATLNRPPAADAAGRGIISWRGSLYSVFGTKIYKGTTDLGVTLTTSTGLCGMSYTRPGAATQYLAINDGVKLYLIDTSDVVTTITSNFPTPNTTDLVYMDGYFFTLKSDGTIWNCDYDDPTTWNPVKFITVQMFNGSGVGLAHQNNLLVGFSNQHTQSFYDAANASGSPLSNVEQAMQQVGCVSQNSICYDESHIVWVSNSFTGGYAVVLLDGMTGLKNISTPGIERLLRLEGTSISSCNADIIRVAGHFFYILYLPSQGRTLVFDLDQELWMEWQGSSGSFFPIVSYCQHLNTLVAQHMTNGNLYTMSEATYQDASANFTVFARFSRFDGDTNVRKFVRRLELIGDVQSTTTNVSLVYYDNDYTTASTARTLDMSLVRPFAMNLGNFRRRAWELSYTGANPLRVEALEMQVRTGIN